MIYIEPGKMTVEEKIEAIEEFLKDSEDVLNCPSISGDSIQTRKIHLSMIQAHEQLKELKGEKKGEVK